MAVERCGNCGGVDTSALADRFQCLSCGASTPYPGTDAEEVGVVVPQGGVTTVRSYGGGEDGVAGSGMTTTKSASKASSSKKG